METPFYNNKKLLLFVVNLTNFRYYLNIVIVQAIKGLLYLIYMCKNIKYFIISLFGNYEPSQATILLFAWTKPRGNFKFHV